MVRHSSALARADAQADRTSIDTCRMLDLPKIHDPRGNLTFIESNHHIPFAIERVYYLYDVPGGSERGGHASFMRARWN